MFLLHVYGHMCLWWNDRWHRFNRQIKLSFFMSRLNQFIENQRWYFSKSGVFSITKKWPFNLMFEEKQVIIPKLRKCILLFPKTAWKNISQSRNGCHLELSHFLWDTRYKLFDFFFALSQPYLQKNRIQWPPGEGVVNGQIKKLWERNDTLASEKSVFPQNHRDN